MDSWTNWPPALIDRLGEPSVVAALGPRVRLAPAGDRQVVVKMGPAVRDEAAGLLRLARVEGAPRVPDVLHIEGELLVLEWIEAGGRDPAGDTALGRGLAALHGQLAGEWGGGSSWIGECEVDPAPEPTAAEFYGRRLMDLADRCGLAGVVSPVVERLPTLIPPGDAALLHGDLWWGNVLWASSGEVVLIDPSVHGGHPEEDLAMLGLFGSVPAELLEAYTAVRPLDDGWEDRVCLWQLYLLLVHTVLFGGSYRASAEKTARCYA